MIYSLLSYSDVPFVYFFSDMNIVGLEGYLSGAFRLEVNMGWTSSLGVPVSPRLECLTSGLRRRGRILPCYRNGACLLLRPQSFSLSALPWAKEKPSTPPTRVAIQPPWMAHGGRGAAAADLVYGTCNGNLRGEIAFSHWFMCLLYPTGTFAAPEASPTVTGTQQWWLYPLKSNL